MAEIIKSGFVVVKHSMNPDNDNDSVIYTKYIAFFAK